jgi:hypothetical protein
MPDPTYAPNAFGADYEILNVFHRGIEFYGAANTGSGGSITYNNDNLSSQFWQFDRSIHTSGNIQINSPGIGVVFSDDTVQTTANIMLAAFTMSNHQQWTSNVSTIGDALNQLAAGNANNTGNFIFSGNDAALPLGNDMTLSTYQNGGNKESKLTLSTSGISSLDVGNNLRIRVGNGTGFEDTWTFGAGGSITFPDASSLTTGNIMASLFSMANATHWTESVTTIGAALNQLAARIHAIENP